ncbi:hypothetical protein PLICRDRAFT_618934 [Plicaturopsis crispa FD-325 SS-3]|nr:hypothetical protein PLICRDRAFT_618934 [Plicaturopsis crispa FD-325 SS-3]
MPASTYSALFDIQTPAPVSALSIGNKTSLLVGSEDGSLRLYDISSPKVSKAIRGLGSEVSSAIFSSKKDCPEVWVACGRKILSFDLGNSQKLVLSPTDATFTVEVGEDEENIVNEIASSKTDIAYSTDSGTVGVIDTVTKNIVRMKTKHSNICGTVKWIPDRPREIVSGGYDSALLHFDFPQGTTLSRYDITSPPPTSGVSLSPPFILSTAVSSNGVIAVGTADGQLWLGGGGEKRPASSSKNKKKRSRKWEGLQESDSIAVKIAEGPVVAIAFADPATLISCTLLGTVTQHQISRSTTEDDRLELVTAWTQETKSMAKVNAMAVDDEHIVIGGFRADGKGAVELLKKDNPMLD